MYEESYTQYFDEARDQYYSAVLIENEKNRDEWILYEEFLNENEIGLNNL